MVSLAGFDPATAQYFWDNVLHITTKQNRITTTNVDNGPGAPSEAAGSAESDLHVEQAGALAPDASIVVYQAPNSEGGFADAFFAAASQNLADTLSSSWSESETLLLASAAAGGGTINASIAAQRTWAWDWLWPYYAALGLPTEAAAAAGAAIGGGGYSSYQPLPLYQAMLTQQNAPGVGSFSGVPYLKPADYGTVDGLYLPAQSTFDSNPTIVTGEGNGRALPDLATEADPFTGNLLYDPLASPTLQGGWGGTSVAAAQLNGAAALIDQKVGHRVGLWNPAIYSFARRRARRSRRCRRPARVTTTCTTPARTVSCSTPVPGSGIRTWASSPATSASRTRGHSRLFPGFPGPGPRCGRARKCRTLGV